MLPWWWDPDWEGFWRGGLTDYLAKRGWMDMDIYMHTRIRSRYLLGGVEMRMGVVFIPKHPR